MTRYEARQLLGDVAELRVQQSEGVRVDIAENLKALKFGGHEP